MTLVIYTETAYDQMGGTVLDPCIIVNGLQGKRCLNVILEHLGLESGLADCLYALAVLLK